MREILDVFPGAQRVLFREFHIGGCASCAFRPDERLAEVCARAGVADPEAAIAAIHRGHESDEQIWLEPEELAELLKGNVNVKLLDVRTRDEFEAVRIPGAELMSQPVMQDIMATWVPENPLVIVDHVGAQSLDAAAYFLGHGLRNVRALRGGIDTWAQRVDPSMRRYVIE